MVEMGVVIVGTFAGMGKSSRGGLRRILSGGGVHHHGTVREIGR